MQETSVEDHAADQGSAGTDARDVGVSEQALTSTLTAIGDTVVRAGLPDGNDGTGIAIGVTQASIADVKKSLIQFSQANMKAIVGTNVLYSARLDVTIAGISAGWIGGGVDVMPMTHTWAEGNGLFGHGATWNCADDKNTTIFGFGSNCLTGDLWGMSQPSIYPRPFSPTATDRQPIFTGGLGMISFDVTNDVRKFLSGALVNNGWLIAGATNLVGGEWVDFSSREGANPPKLVLDFGPDLCPADPNKGAPGKCGCGVPDLDTNYDHVADCFDASAIATGDTAVRLATPISNDGKGLFLPATSASIASLERSLIKFDNSVITAARNGGPVDKVYLDLTVAGIDVGWFGGKVALNRMNPTPQWVEGTGLLGWGATWSCADDVNTTLLNLGNDCNVSDQWFLSPIQGTLFANPFVATPTATVGITWPGMNSVRFDVTNDVKQWIADPSSNNGWIIQGWASNFASGAWVDFGSRESGAPPRLVFTLPKTCPTTGKASPGQCGCAVPDTDTDHDTVADCLDQCPNDVNKSKPGTCGCNVPDIDTDGDKLYDCIDPCPKDNDPTLGGVCGCPSSTRAPAGTTCTGVCGGSGDPGGKDTCDGAGHCGTPSNRATCPAPDPTCTSCTPYLRKTNTSATPTYTVYWVCSCAKTRDGAETACEGTQGQHLLSIESGGENAWVRSVIGADAWTGGNDKTKEGDWRWSFNAGKFPNSDNGGRFWSGNTSGSANGYANWMSGEPGGNTTESCAAMSFASATGQWQDRTCGTSLGWICEKLIEQTTDTTDYVEPIDRTCTFLARDCTDYSTLPCIQPSALPNGSASQATQKGQLDTCAACTKDPVKCPNSNGPNGTPTATDQNTCKTNCASQCTGAAAQPPTSGARCTDGDAYALTSSVSNPPPEKHCPIVPPTSGTLTACTKNANCSGGKTCGESFHCRECDPTKTFCPSCNGEQDPSAPRTKPFEACTPHIVGAIDQNVCVADKYCGTAVPECFLNDNSTDWCAEYNLCIDPANVVTPTEPPNAAALEAPVPFEPDKEFTAPTVAPVVQYYPDDFGCGSSCTDPNAAGVNSQAHPWCHHDITDPLNHQAPATLKKPVNAGSSSILSFSTDPYMNLDYGIKNGPLGLPLPSLSAEAAFSASANINIFGYNKPKTLIDVGAKAAGGIDLTNTVCGFNASARAKVLGLDIIPGKAMLRYPDQIDPSTGVDYQQECVDTVKDFQSTVDAARKAFSDARELVRQYNANYAKVDGSGNPAPEVFSDGSGTVPSLCSTILSSPPRGFPDWGWDCKTEPPVVTLDRFISYYNDVAIKRIQDTARQLGTKLDGAVNAGIGEIPVTDPVDENDEITLWNTTFFIGPVPANLELLLIAQYKVNIGVVNEFRVGKLMADFVSGLPLTDDNPLFKVGVDGGPSAGVGLSLFAGVGFDLGPLSAKLGIDGAIDFGQVGLPAYGWAGVGMDTEPDARVAPTSWDTSIDTTIKYIPTARLKFKLMYGYGADLKIDNVLSGSLGLRLKIKFFFFSVNYRKALVSFKGLCVPGPANTKTRKTPGRQDWCDITLFTAGGSDNADWGTVRLPMPFFRLKPLPWPSIVSTKIASYNGAPAQNLFYDTQCTCIPNWNAAKPPKQDCFRKEDCCNGRSAGSQITCFKDPIPVNGKLRSECTTCRVPRTGVTGDTCSKDDECCDPANNSCFFDPDPRGKYYGKGVGTCRPKQGECQDLCGRDADCRAGLACIGPVSEAVAGYSGARHCLAPGDQNCPIF